MHPRAPCTSGYYVLQDTCRTPAVPPMRSNDLRKEEQTAPPSMTTTRSQAQGSEIRDSRGPAPNVVFRIRRSHWRGIQDRWSGNEATIRPCDGRRCTPQHLVLCGTYNSPGQEYAALVTLQGEAT